MVGIPVCIIQIPRPCKPIPLYTCILLGLALKAFLNLQTQNGTVTGIPGYRVGCTVGQGIYQEVVGSGLQPWLPRAPGRSQAIRYWFLWSSVKYGSPEAGCDMVVGIYRYSRYGVHSICILPSYQISMSHQYWYSMVLGSYDCIPRTELCTIRNGIQPGCAPRAWGTNTSYTGSHLVPY